MSSIINLNFTLGGTEEGIVYQVLASSALRNVTTIALENVLIAANPSFRNYDFSFLYFCWHKKFSCGDSKHAVPVRRPKRC